ncbi:hypothetical protein MAPG_09505 [Magnaporthiopsis poae ATCC 64411]|uniref:Zn(2)-C6 fungal-type domain-containing protein n=1 Tax=Magnaporthiopsis poae (strain ATCC 64411 / 73-15) TaxID=644358 RepID=A0A0C4EA47_MAGP6|nr:hypothetical protein MAPG_09505 [Magnaporthiopsis poae ATCC 64411]
MDDAAPKRHCWECRRQNLVCDAAKPGCRRCAAADTACPGYGDVKPTRLRWLAPGRVKSRAERRPNKTAATRNGGDTCHEALVVASTACASHHAAAAASPVPVIVGESPELADTAHLLFQTMEYCKSNSSRLNSCIYMDMQSIHELGRHPNLYKISVAQVRQGVERPAYLQFGMMCMALVHRMNRTGGPDCPRSKAMAQQFYQFRGIAIRGLSHGLDAESSLADNCLIAGILTILLNDVSSRCPVNWRYHLQGLYRLIMLRGGFVALAESPGMESLLTSFWSVAVYGNTTCPANDLVGASTCLDCIDFIVQRCTNATTAFQLCPPELFTEIIKINHLRSRAATAKTQPRQIKTCPGGGAAVSPDDDELTREATEIMARVAAFSPDLWADRKQHQPSRASWALAGTLYQASVMMNSSNLAGSRARISSVVNPDFSPYVIR